MIKDKLDKCSENNPSNINVKDENTPSCDSTSKDSGQNFKYFNAHTGPNLVKTQLIFLFFTSYRLIYLEIPQVFYVIL